MRAKLFGSVAAVALLGAASGPAQAFDSTYWQWDFDNYQNIFNNAWVWASFYPSGITAVEEIQVYVGDVTATAILDGDYVAPDSATVTSGTIDFTVSWEGTQDDTPDPSTFGTDTDGSLATLGGDLSGTGVLNGILDEGSDEMSLTASFEDIEVEGLEITFNYEPVDANEGLGHAVQEVSAVGVVASIESNFPVYADQVQVLIGANEYDSDDLPWNEHHHGHHGGGNWMTDVVEILTDLVDQSEISAFAAAGSFWNPVEIAIDQSVQAVAEMYSITLEVDEPYVIASANEDESEYNLGDSNIDTRDTIFSGYGAYGNVATYYPVNTNAILEADVTQFAYANTTATAIAFQDLTAFSGLASYTGLSVDTPGLVANQAVSAAGLVSSISNTIKVPDVTE